MTIPGIIWLLFHLVMTVALVACFVSWYRNGATVPRWVHRLAIILGICGIAVTAFLWFAGWLTPQLAFSCLLIPPTVAYVGWFWMFGPWARH